MFSARFDKYENGPVKAIRLKEVRTRFGGEVKPTLTFKEGEVENFPTALGEGDFAAFIADLDPSWNVFEVKYKYL